MNLGRLILRRGRQAWYRLIFAPPMARLWDRWRRPLHLGDRGERYAARYLLRQGWVIVARGYEDATGEIDLIAVDDDTLVFVEVKTRTSWERGHPAEAVDLDKQIQISRVALGFRRWHHLPNVRTRFDIIALTWPPEADQPRLQHYVHAFESVGESELA